MACKFYEPPIGELSKEEEDVIRKLRDTKKGYLTGILNMGDKYLIKTVSPGGESFESILERFTARDPMADLMMQRAMQGW